MKPVLSIIVPVYNVEKYVAKCLECLINQTLHDIEIILVNDGSTDGSLAICETYASKDYRIRLFSKPNGGLSDARNYGLARVQADVIGFVDSDDTIDLDMFEQLMQLKQQNHCQIAVAGVKMVNDQDETYLFRSVHGTEVMNRHDAMKELLISKRILNAVWNKIFDKALLQDTVFPINTLYEDEYFTYKLFNRAECVVMTDKTAYHYRQNPGSITHRKFSEHELDRVFASEIKIGFCKDHYPDLTVYARRYLVYDCCMALSKMEKYDSKYDALIKASIRNNLIIFLSGENSFSMKLFAIITAISPKLTVWLWRRMKNGG